MLPWLTRAQSASCSSATIGCGTRVMTRPDEEQHRSGEVVKVGQEAVLGHPLSETRT
jgi:hypothetical protein